MTSEAPSQTPAIRQFRDICEAVVQPMAWSGKGDAGRSMMERARQLLDDGLNPNAVDEDGISLIGRVALLTRGSNEAGTRLGNLLMERGANPMLFDRPLGRDLCHQNASLLTTNTIFFLARQEGQGQGLRDAHGGTVLHYLAQGFPSLANGYLNDDLYAEPGEECFPEAMINQPRLTDGRTPLDVLWNLDAPELVAAALQERWEMTASLLARGADALLVPQEGPCVAERLEAWILAGLRTDDTGSWRKIEAALGQQRMDANTEQALPEARRGGLRL